ncbi:hypothetical protein THF1C08_360004 [Vibrio jasicida]|nr:hypothetical protein THF1C08_360004 [Vibrio jasicida]
MPRTSCVTVLKDTFKSYRLKDSKSIHPDIVIMIMVTKMAIILQVVQAPAPALGNPSIPAPTQTLAIIQAPPNKDGFFSMFIFL